MRPPRAGRRHRRGRKTVTDGRGITTTYTYDNELTYVTEPGGAKTSFEYDKNGKPTKTTFPGGTTQTVTPDESSRPVKVEVKSGASPRRHRPRNSRAVTAWTGDLDGPVRSA
ncbi:hypothetical protein AB0N19_20990 [Streptomyces sp. NPDC051132]|uniref:hypothetical protein n=1 Tax=Streptomyces sp. NPDC051132 TaxID=3155667 RepID=UPI003443718A